MKKILNILQLIDQFFANIIIKIIQIYQHTISPDHSHGGKAMPFVGCKFYPSCSEYGIQTLKKRGFLLGFPRVVWRILRCHPWAKGGVDRPL